MLETNRARETTDAIERLYVTMRHLFYRGNFKPTGISGTELKKLLLKVSPEIYGSMIDPNKIELKGLLYVLDRLPEGIEECSYVHLTSDEGFSKSSFKPIYPKKRRRICYRIDQHQMNIEVLLGKSEIYDILTHLTFLYIEADKINARSKDDNGKNRLWEDIEKAAMNKDPLTRNQREVVLTHLSSILGRSFDEIMDAYNDFKEPNNPDRFIKIIYHLGNVSKNDYSGIRSREINFSTILIERVGHHIFGTKWAKNIKKILIQNKLDNKQLHIISSNMHSVKNVLFARTALNKPESDRMKMYEGLSDNENYREKVQDLALNKGMIYIKDTSGCNIDVQIFDLSKIDLKNTPYSLLKELKDKVLIVFDYAFGEQAFEVMDELLKPFIIGEEEKSMNIKSISVMGKAGILVGKKGEIMIPTYHAFEGTADNYPFENDLSVEDFKEYKIKAYKGGMITVLGTSLQNKDILTYFKDTSWKSIGLEMEGAHYQKAIQIASKIRQHVKDEVIVRYAYYASDNPLKTGSTLASGGLGLTGILPTYAITEKILEKIFLA